MRASLSVARALMARPPLLVLDEPTRSLDPLATVAMGELLRQLAAEGHAVLLSSHRLDEVAAVCDRVIVLIGGTVRFDGTTAELETDGQGVAASLVEVLSRETGRP
jgi:ABC-2 type transport system ATP-binding protein